MWTAIHTERWAPAPRPPRFSFPQDDATQAAYMSDPIIPFGYKSLREAFDALGMQMFDDQWTGKEAEARTPEQRAREKEEEIKIKREKVAKCQEKLPHIIELPDGTEAITYGGELVVGLKDESQLRDEFTAEIRSLAAIDPTALSLEDISQISDEVEREGVLRRFYRDSEARAAEDAIEDAARGRRNSTDRELRRRLCTPGWADAKFRRDVDGRHLLIPSSVWVSNFFRFSVSDSRATSPHTQGRWLSGTVMFSDANFDRLLCPEWPRKPTARHRGIAQPTTESGATPLQSRGELIANDEAAEKGTILRKKPHARRTRDAHKVQDGWWNRARELWLEKKKRKRSDIILLILKEKGLSKDKGFDSVRKSLERAEKRKGPYDAPAQPGEQDVQ